MSREEITNVCITTKGFNAAVLNLNGPVELIKETEDRISIILNYPTPTEICWLRI